MKGRLAFRVVDGKGETLRTYAQSELIVRFVKMNFCHVFEVMVFAAYCFLAYFRVQK